MMLQVIKRDGRTVEFDKSKIRNAVLKAFEEVDSEISQKTRLPKLLLIFLRKIRQYVLRIFKILLKKN